MVYKKNCFTYLGYTLFGLLLAGLIFLSSGLHMDFSENNIIKNLIIIVPVAASVFIIWLASYLFSTLSNKLSGKHAVLLYNIVVCILFAAAVGVRAYYILTYTEAFPADGYDLIVSVSACFLGVLKLVIVYLIGLIAFGKQGAAVSLFFESFLAGEIESCAVMDYRNVSMLIVLAVILLYSIYYKRCNNGKMATAVSWLIIVSITLIISAGIGVSIYLDYSAAVPFVLAAALILSMLFAGWKQALVPVLGIPALCASAYFGVSVAGESYGVQLNNEIEYRMADIEKLFDEPEGVFDEIVEYTEHSVMFDDSLTFTIPGGYEYNHDVLVNMVFMFLSLCSLIFLFFKKRSPLSAYILFSVGIFLFDSNIMLCNVFIISLCFQELYEGRDRISYIVNSSVIDMEDEETDTDAFNADAAFVPEAAVSAENVVQDYSGSGSAVEENIEYVEGISSNESPLYEDSVADKSDSIEETSAYKDSVYENSVYEDSVYEESTVYGVSEPYGSSVPEYGTTEPLDLTESEYGAVEPQDYTDADYGSPEEAAGYTGSNYGSAEPEYSSGTDYGSLKESSEYTGSNYGSVESEYGSSTNYGSPEESSEYTGSNYGSVELEYGSSTNYGSPEESSEYTGSNYGSAGPEYSSGTDYSSPEEPSEYSGSVYGAVKADDDFTGDILDRLPVPKPVSVYVDDNAENVIFKKSFDNEKETADNSFDKDMWQNRRKRATKHTQD